MNAKAYLELMKKQREELNNFPIAYAFDEKQLQEALEKLGATREECVTVCGHGDVMKRTDVPKFTQLLKRHKEELYELLKDEDAAEGAFRYEMDNHEYFINWDGDADVLACFNLTEEKLKEMGLVRAYLRARKAHMKFAEDQGFI